MNDEFQASSSAKERKNMYIHHVSCRSYGDVLMVIGLVSVSVQNCVLEFKMIFLWTKVYFHSHFYSVLFTFL
jgi:hypothetical protein